MPCNKKRPRRILFETLHESSINTRCNTTTDRHTKTTPMPTSPLPGVQRSTTIMPDYDMPDWGAVAIHVHHCKTPRIKISAVCGNKAAHWKRGFSKSILQPTDGASCASTCPTIGSRRRHEVEKESGNRNADKGSHMQTKREKKILNALNVQIHYGL